MDWKDFENGTSIGTVGSESGSIVEDVENINGARITIEKDGDIAPFAVTLGIYGLMFHTYFTGTIEEAKGFLEFAKSKIDEIFKHHDTPENERDHLWETKLDFLMNELSEQS